MGQQEYEAFKAKLREWMNTHLEEYAAFEEAMNARDYAGCQSVIFQAMSLIQMCIRDRPGAAFEYTKFY